MLLTEVANYCTLLLSTTLEVSLFFILTQSHGFPGSEQSMILPENDLMPMCPVMLDKTGASGFALH